MQVVVMIRHPAAYAGSLRRLHWTHDFSHFLDQPGLVDTLVPDLRADIEEFARRPPDIVDQAALLWNVIYTVIAGTGSSTPTGSSSATRTSRPIRREASAGSSAGSPWSTRRPSPGSSKRPSSASNPAEADEGVVHTLRRDSAASVRTWHDRLTADEVARVRARTEETAALFYADSAWSLPTTA